MILGLDDLVIVLYLLANWHYVHEVWILFLLNYWRSIHKEIVGVFWIYFMSFFRINFSCWECLAHLQGSYFISVWPLSRAYLYSWVRGMTRAFQSRRFLTLEKLILGIANHATVEASTTIFPFLFLKCGTALWVLYIELQKFMS